MALYGFENNFVGPWK